MFMVFLVGCMADPPKADGTNPPSRDPFEADRTSMVLKQLRSRDISDEKVLVAMAKVPRHLFVPSALRSMAYSDGPLPIGSEQTISQPYIVAYMTQALELKPGVPGFQKVLIQQCNCP